MTSAVQGLDQKSLDHVYSLAYEELRRLARGLLRGEKAVSVTPTALVNEAWLKLRPCQELAQTSQAHFRNIAAHAMRQVLVDMARRRQAKMRGAGRAPVTLEESLLPTDPLKDIEGLLALDGALHALAAISLRQARLVESHFFGGLTWAELANLHNISEATVMREWRAARAWLGVYLRPAATASNKPRTIGEQHE